MTTTVCQDNHECRAWARPHAHTQGAEPRSTQKGNVYCTNQKHRGPSATTCEVRVPETAAWAKPELHSRACLPASNPLQHNFGVNEHSSSSVCGTISTTAAMALATSSALVPLWRPMRHSDINNATEVAHVLPLGRWPIQTIPQVAHAEV